MAEEEKEETTEQAAAAEGQAPAEAALDTAAPEPVALDPAAPEPVALDPAAPDEPAAPAEPAEVVPPKERRQRSRAAKAAKAKPPAPRTPEERQAARVADRRRKAEVRRGLRTREREKARAGRSEVAPTAAREHAPGKQKTRQGVVVSDGAAKTITVRIDVARRHPRYTKIVRTSTTLHAHDERDEAHVGDTVIVRESRPLSRSKRWRLIEVLERAK